MGRASVFLSLNRFEGMSLTVVEAMAAQCLVAGFTGLGPREYTSPINGLWVEEEDCEACARALVEAVVMAEQNSGPAALMRHAAAVTAEQWSHARFTRALETFWRGQIDAPHPHPAPGLGNSGACG
jgi:glycosyltransferase involved in cell wall biosynthesis